MATCSITLTEKSEREKKKPNPQPSRRETAAPTRERLIRFTPSLGESLEDTFGRRFGDCMVRRWQQSSVRLLGSRYASLVCLGALVILFKLDSLVRIFCLWLGLVAA